jgi:dienelactone hydrolase
VKPAALVILFVLALAACGGGSSDSSSSSSGDGTATAGQLALYNYDASAPIGLRDTGALKFKRPYPITFHNITYLSPKGGYVPGFLVLPPGKGPYPGVILLHGSGEDDQTLLPEASWLAARGMVAMTITAAESRPPSAAGQQDTAHPLKQQRDLAVQTVIDVRRGIDLLRSLPQVGKKQPVGFLGFSAGGKQGAVLSGVDHRLGAIVLVSAGSPSLKKVLAEAPAGSKATIGAFLGATDPARFIGRDTSPLLIQIGKKDEYVPQGDLQAVVNAAPKSAEVKRYNGGHVLLETRAAVHDMLAFLATKLHAGPRVQGAEIGP